MVFANFADQRVYRLEAGADPRPITPEAPLRYADFDLDPTGRRAVCVCEDHRGSKEPVNAAGDAGPGRQRGEGRVLVSGGRLLRRAPPVSGRPATGLAILESPQHAVGRHHPVARRHRRGRRPDRFAPGRRRADISAFQPEWSPDGTFHFVDDSNRLVEPVLLTERCAGSPLSAAGGVRSALWQFGMKSFGFLADGRLVCRVIEDGVGRLATITQDRLETIATPFSHAGLPQSLGGRLALIGATRSEPPRLSLWDPDTNTEEVLQRATGSGRRPGIRFASGSHYLSHGGRAVGPRLLLPAPQPGPRGPGGGTSAPHRPLPRRPHGGHQRRLFLGHPVLDQPRLRRRRRELRRQHRLWARLSAAPGGRWGIVDVEDCVNAARFLAESGRADPDRLIIRGGSAGGYTTLAALAFRDTFRGRRQPLRHRRPDGPGPGHTQI